MGNALRIAVFLREFLEKQIFPTKGCPVFRTRLPGRSGRNRQIPEEIS